LPHHLMNSKIFLKKSYWTYNVLFVSKTFTWNISHSKNWAIYDKKCTLVFM
jgi:hypothetical protein